MRRASPARLQSRSEKSLGGRIRRLVFSDANFLDDAQVRVRGCGPRAALPARRALTLIRPRRL